MKPSRLHRILKLIGLLQAGTAYNVDGLARACGVCRRTIFRDLDALRESGVPLDYDQQYQRYRLPGTFYLPPTNFTPEEALALIVLCHELGDRCGLPFFESARSAVVKLESSLPGPLRHHVRNVAAAVHVQPPPSNPLEGQKPIYDQLLQASSNRRSVRILYESLTEWEKIRTRLDPYRLLFSRRSWYVIGRSSLHRAVRTFNVSRVLKVEPLEEHFAIPRGFSVDRYLRNAWHLIPEPGRDHQVLIRFSKMVAQNVAEVAWHKTQRVKMNADGTLDFRVTVSGLKEISWWILGYGDQAEVIRPAKLRRLVAERAQRTAQTYGLC